MLPEGIVSIPKDVLSQRIEDETVVLNTATGDYFGLNDVATRAWELLQENHGPRDIAIRLAEEFDATKDRIEADLSQLLDELRRKHLIES